MKPRIFHSRRYYTAPVYRAESIAYFATHAVQLSTVQKTLVDAQFDLLITSGAWLESDVIVFPMLMTEQQSAVNWKAPGTHNAIPMSFGSSFVPKVGYPAVSANSTYLRTQYTPYVNGVKWQPSNAKALVYVKDNVQDDGYVMGGSANGNTMMRPRDTADSFTAYLNGAQPTGQPNADGSGLFSVSTSDGVNLVRKRNNSVIATVAATFNGSRTNSELFVYCWNNAGTASNFINNNTIQCYAFGSAAMDDSIFKTVRDNLAAGL